MSQELQKIRKEAQTKAAKGDLGGALAAYQKALKLDPADTRLWVNIGDICLKLGQKKEAIQIYEKAATQYAAQNDLRRAVSVHQAILNVYPKHPRSPKQLKILQSRIAIAKASDGGDTVAQFYAEGRDKKQDGVIQISATEALVHDDTAISFEDDEDTASKPGGTIFDYADEPSEPDQNDETMELTGKIRDDIVSQPVIASSPEERLHKVLENMPTIPLFAGLKASAIASVGSAIELHTFDPGEEIIIEGAHGDSVYVIASGSASMTKKDPNDIPVGLAILNETNFFGEAGFLTGQARTATVCAYDECRVIEIGKFALDALIAKEPKIRKILENFYRRRLIDATVAISPIFRLVPDDVRATLVNALESGVIPAGTVLCEQGSQATAIYLIVSGEIEVTKKSETGNHSVESLSAGQSFGEISIARSIDSPATYLTTAESRILKLKGGHFRSLLDNYPIVAESVNSIVDDRLRKINQSVGT